MFVMGFQWAKMLRNVRDSVEELIYWVTKCPCRRPSFSLVASWGIHVDLRVTACLRPEPMFWVWNKDLDPCLTWAFALLLFLFTALPWESQLKECCSYQAQCNTFPAICSHSLYVRSKNCCFTWKKLEQIKYLMKKQVYMIWG